MKVISFCLWGNKTIYTVGLIENIILARKYYPNWECWVYVHSDTVPADIKEELKRHDNVKIILKLDKGIRSKRFMLWRFEPADSQEVELFISRDTDSRISPREVLAVQEWEDSGKTLHIMRDSPRHFPKILGGMFGLRCKNIISAKSEKSWEDEIDLFYRYASEDTDDQVFLQNSIYSRYSQDSMVHDEIMKYEGEQCLNFPIPFEQNFHHVGCYINPDGSSDPETTQVLRDWLLSHIPDRINRVPVTYEQTLIAISEKIKTIYVTQEKTIRNTLLDKFINVIPQEDNSPRFLAYLNIFNKIPCNEFFSLIVSTHGSLLPYVLGFTLDNLPEKWDVLKIQPDIFLINNSSIKSLLDRVEKSLPNFSNP